MRKSVKFFIVFLASFIILLQSPSVIFAEGYFFTPTSKIIGQYGTEWGNEDSLDPDISRSGNYITFTTSSTNLVVGDNNNRTDCYRWDDFSDELIIVSRDPSSGILGNGNSSYCRVNDFGDVVFQSDSTNLAPQDNNGVTDVFVYYTSSLGFDRLSIVSKHEDEGLGGFNYGNEWSGHPDIADGGPDVSVYFATDADNIGESDTNGLRDIYATILDPQNENVEHQVISRLDNGTEANGKSENPRVDLNVGQNIDDIVYQTQASNLVNMGPTSFSNWQIVHTGRVFGSLTHELISKNQSGQIGNASSTYPVMCYVASTVAWVSSATNFDSGDTNNVDDIYIDVLEYDHAILASTGPSSSISNGQSMYPSISSVCNAVAYRSFATNLVTDDTNQQPDVFLIRLVGSYGLPNPQGPNRLSEQHNGDEVADRSAQVSLNSNGRAFVIATKANDLALSGYGLPNDPPYPDPWQVLEGQAAGSSGGGGGGH